MSYLIDCQSTVERLLTDGRTLAEVEEYVEHCALDEMEKAGLWMLAWAHQDQATQLDRQRDARAPQQYAKPNKVRSERAPPWRAPGAGDAPRGSSITRPATGILTEIEAQRFDDAVATIEKEERTSDVHF